VTATATRQARPTTVSIELEEEGDPVRALESLARTVSLCRSLRELGFELEVSGFLTIRAKLPSGVDGGQPAGDGGQGE
jgi:hypothetical protein